MKYSSLVLGFLLVLTACNSSGGGGGSKKAEDPINVPPIEEEGEPTPGSLKILTKRKVEILKDFSNVEDFKTNINTYVFNFEAQAGHYVGAKVECAKTNFDQSKNSVESSFDSRGLTARLEFSLEPTDPNFVDVECVVSDRKEILEKEVVRLHKSIVVSGRQNAFALGLGNGEEIETLMFDEGGVLITDGQPFFQKTNNVVSRSGRLVTFDPETKYTLVDNVNGPSGGQIIIETKKALGTLLVELRGLNGGKQAKIPETVTTVPAADPKLNGTCSSVGNNSHNDKKCFGKQGHQGHQGKTGNPGLKGGNTGSFKFKSLAENKLKFIVNYFPGKGSEGGIGGEGGPGGPGGIGNKVTEPRDPPGPRDCPRCLKSMYGNSHKFPNGPQGVKGNIGANGIPGTDGEIEDSAVEMLWEELLFEFNYNWKNF